MRNDIDVINQLPADFETGSAKEFAPLPDEFNREAPPKKPLKKKPSTIRKVMLYMATAGVVTIGVITPVVKLNPPEEPPKVVETIKPSAPASKPAGLTAVSPKATVRPTDTPKPTAPPTETPSPTPTEEPTPTPTPTPTPRMTGQIHITIYSEVFDNAAAGQDGYPSEVLSDETIPAETFSEYRLPPLPEQEGYTALGYVLLKSSGSEYLESLCNGSAKPSVIGTVALGETLTADDLEIVPKSIEGIYDAEIHVVWLANDSKHILQFYDGRQLFGEYKVGFPVESEQMIYLAPFPVPQHEGKTFTGWCDVDGFMVDAVTYYDFFEKTLFPKVKSDRKLNRPMPCKVYACWSDGSGGAPRPTPRPTPTPSSTPTIYYTVSLDPMLSFAEPPAGSSGGGGSRSIASGRSVTVFVSVYNFPGDTVQFVINYLDSGTTRTVYAGEYKYVELNEEEFICFYKTTFTVTENISVEFPW